MSKLECHVLQQSKRPRCTLMSSRCIRTSRPGRLRITPPCTRLASMAWGGEWYWVVYEHVQRLAVAQREPENVTPCCIFGTTRGRRMNFASGPLPPLTPKANPAPAKRDDQLETVLAEARALHQDRQF